MWPSILSVLEAVLSNAPELIADVEKLINGLKSQDPTPDNSNLADKVLHDTKALADALKAKAK